MAQSEVMQITVATAPVEQIQADALIVPVFEGRKETRFSAGALCRLRRNRRESRSNSPCFTTLAGVTATRVLLAGAGKPEKFDARRDAP